MYQASYERQKSRDRSRQRERKHGGRSPSQGDEGYQRRQRQKYQRTPKSKRVKQIPLSATLGCYFFKFEGNDDIRVFRKQDQPIARGLSQEQVLRIKADVEKQVAKSYDFNWEHYKHRDALLQNNSMKEQKEKEKALSEKLLSVKEALVYFSPPRLGNVDKLIQIGCGSSQRQAHTARIHDILGCYYTHASEIPNQPQFQILNTNTTFDTKTIKFDNESFSEVSVTTTRKNNENGKLLKGILKMPNLERVERGRSQPRQIDPQLIYLLKDFKLNPHIYTKQKKQQCLKPYKDSGELDYLMKNKEVLEAMLKSTSMAPPAQMPKQSYLSTTPSIAKESSERSGSQPGILMPGGFTHTFVPKADKFRTVPCKYYHGQAIALSSPQGCSKVDNCTFIHDERYPGVPTPNSQPTPMVGAPQQQKFAQPFNPYPSYNPMYNYPMNPGTSSSATPNAGSSQLYPGYSNHPMSYPTNPGAYYSSQNPSSGMSSGISSGMPSGMNPGMGGGMGQNYQQGYQMNQSNNPQYGQQGQQQYSMPAPNGQSYANPNYQYYIGNNQTK